MRKEQVKPKQNTYYNRSPTATFNTPLNVQRPNVFIGGKQIPMRTVEHVKHQRPFQVLNGCPITPQRVKIQPSRAFLSPNNENMYPVSKKPEIKQTPNKMNECFYGHTTKPVKNRYQEESSPLTQVENVEPFQTSNHNPAYEELDAEIAKDLYEYLKHNQE